MGDGFGLQREGIPQGSNLSTMLACIWLGYVERGKRKQTNLLTHNNKKAKKWEGRGASARPFIVYSKRLEQMFFKINLMQVMLYPRLDRAMDEISNYEDSPLDPARKVFCCCCFYNYELSNVLFFACVLSV